MLKIFSDYISQRNDIAAMSSASVTTATLIGQTTSGEVVQESGQA